MGARRIWPGFLHFVTFLMIREVPGKTDRFRSPREHLVNTLRCLAIAVNSTDAERQR
jgi:hypothetical protein